MLSCVLADEGLPNSVRERILSEYEEIGVAKSSDRSVIGSSNEIAFHYQHRILEAGGIHSWRIPEIIRELNRLPLQALSHVFPIDELRHLYGVPVARRGRGIH